MWSKGGILSYDIFVKSSFKLTVGRIVATSNGKEMVKFHMREPCDHFLIKHLFRINMNITKDCTVKKEHYIFKIDLEDLTENYFGGKYFYGNWTFRSVFAGSECNLLCTITELIMTPKKRN
ncbi:uncharacterized protein LOC134199899 [Bombyx mori]|uniref:uncharacterized protein LOC134199899 n=1 Tax=Bombyx mori TaxID=7091 RepID=UPI000B3CC5CF